MPVIPVLWRLKQEDHEAEDSLGYTVRLCLKNKQMKTKTTIKPLEYIAHYSPFVRVPEVGNPDVVQGESS